MKKATTAILLLTSVAAGAVGIRIAFGGLPRALADTFTPPQGEVLPRARADRPAPAPAAAPAAKATRVEDPKAVYRIPLDGAPIRGPSDALVTVVEFSDLECPFCRRAAATVKQLEEAYRGKVRVAWKHLPLPFHPNAVPAAALAEAARARGGDAAFWSVVDGLFAAEKLDGPAIEAAGRAAGLDAATLRAGDPGRLIERIRKDQALASSLGVTGSPTFFVNGRKLVGAQPLERFKALVDEELARAEGRVAAGWPRGEVYARTVEPGATAPVLMDGPPAAAAPAPRTDVQVALRPDDPARGPAGAKVTVVEFSDFQCPFCSRAVPAVQALEQAFGQEVRVVWKHLPLSFHSNAMPAALAAEAARQQGKFWEMHDRLFAGQAALSDAAYLQHAGALGLDLGRFQAALASPETRKRVEADAAAAAAVGVNGTPTFVVNGEVVVGATALQGAVARQLERARLARK